ncbi:hypothetical protein KIF59_03685 [Enterobacter cloacae subsp. cloacae]|nr:hypothetical protein [Enterobacter cloacae subsp. cloacae]
MTASRSAPVRSSWPNTAPGNISPAAPRTLLARHAADAAGCGRPRSGGTGRLSKLLTGECDAGRLPPASSLFYATIRASAPDAAPGMNIAYLAFNTDKPPLNNPAVRHALALAINNQRLMQSIYYGHRETAASILPRASWA